MKDLLVFNAEVKSKEQAEKWFCGQFENLLCRLDNLLSTDKEDSLVPAILIYIVEKADRGSVFNFNTKDFIKFLKLEKTDVSIIDFEKDVVKSFKALMNIQFVIRGDKGNVYLKGNILSKGCISS